MRLRVRSSGARNRNAACDNAGMPSSLEDPRRFAEPAMARRDPLVEAAERSLAAGAASDAERIDARIDAALADLLVQGSGRKIASTFASAPSAVVARHLARRLVDAWTCASKCATSATLAISVFAIPVVIVAAGDADGGPLRVPGALADPAAAAAILSELGALRGNRTLTLASALAIPDAFAPERLPEWLAHQKLDDGELPRGIDIEPVSIAVAAGEERAVLRFVVGAALSAPGAQLFDADNTRWMTPFAAALRAQLAQRGATLLALPRHVQAPFSALMEGRAAHREIAAQLFASNAIRKFRGSVGEPDAVMSAHRCADARNGGELRLSLSSAFDERGAEGFRCPLYEWERVVDVGGMLKNLLRDCRITRVTVVPGVHPDLDASTGLRLFLRPDAVPARVASLH